MYLSWNQMVRIAEMKHKKDEIDQPTNLTYKLLRHGAEI